MLNALTPIRQSHDVVAVKVRRQMLIWQDYEAGAASNPTLELLFEWIKS